MRRKIRHTGWMLIALISGAGIMGRSSAATTPVVQLDFNDPGAVDQLQLNGHVEPVVINGRQRLRLTEDLGQAGSVWLRRPLQLPSYTAEFDFEVTRTEPNDQPADGFTFTAQEYGPIALGDGGGGLGYDPYPRLQLRGRVQYVRAAGAARKPGDGGGRHRRRAGQDRPDTVPPHRPGRLPRRGHRPEGSDRSHPLRRQREADSPRRCSLPHGGSSSTPISRSGSASPAPPAACAPPSTSST